MIVTEPGPVTPRITFLGRSESCIYLVDGGDESLLIEGGMTCLAPDVLRQIDTFGIDESKIKHLIILHAHFDHCGLIPFFKKRWPWATVSASARAKELLSDLEITRRIADLNQATVLRAGLEAQARQLGFAFTPIDVEKTLRQGDVIPCGDIAAEVIAVPGHSSCAIAVYIPQERALFVSDAAGVRYKDFFLPTANSNFDLYETSLEKMGQYDVDVVLTGHYGGATGAEARSLLPDSLEDSRRDRLVLEASYRRTRDVEESTKELVEMFMEKAPANFLSREVFTIIIGQMLRYIAKSMGDRPPSRR
jgi:glyoxylase-like metal-dependent hydrolase (beta-lactamase superfamily II)